MEKLSLGQLANKFFEEFNSSHVKSKYDLIIIDLFLSKKSDVENISTLSKSIYNALNKKGTAWVACQNQFLDNEYIPVPFITEKVFTKIGLYLQNIIIWVCPNNKNTKYFSNFYKSVIFFSKDKKEYMFNKDKVREKHIWKNVEWGKRAFRYNKKGKDPGNVWLPTKDDGKGNITEHLLLSNTEKNERILKLCSKKKNSILLISPIQNQNKGIDSYLNYSFKENSLPLEKTINNNQTFNNFTHNIYFQDAKKISFLKNNSIKLVVTSPPYWDLKNYGSESQIGKGDSYEDYLQNIKNVFNGILKFLRDDGTIWININTRKIKNEFYNIPLHISEVLKNIGLDLFQEIIWHKSSGIPVNSKNLTDRFEYILGFKKNNNKGINVFDSLVCDYKINKDIMSQHNLLNLNIWNINRPSGSLSKGVPHPAMYPIELPRRIIKRFSSEGDLIFDPFLGSGTTTVASILENRNSYGCELNKDYFTIINRQTEDALSKSSLFSKSHKVYFHN
jgi:DNA modification methylase